MRAFVLCTGRCGSTTFARACAHMSNFTAAHESRIGMADGRLDYPDQHVEVDNRLSWFLGSLGRRFPDAFYVHLRRDPAKVADSYAKRTGVRAGLMTAFHNGILFRRGGDVQTAARLMVETVNDNIAAFVANRRHVTIDIEAPHDPFARFWEAIGADGDLAAAHGELDRVNNAS